MTYPVRLTNYPAGVEQWCKGPNSSGGRRCRAKNAAIRSVSARCAPHVAHGRRDSDIAVTSEPIATILCASSAIAGSSIGLGRTDLSRRLSTHPFDRPWIIVNALTAKPLADDRSPTANECSLTWSSIREWSLDVGVETAASGRLFLRRPRRVIIRPRAFGATNTTFRPSVLPSHDGSESNSGMPCNASLTL
jgi:hypothetical protein